MREPRNALHFRKKNGRNQKKILRKTGGRCSGNVELEVLLSACMCSNSQYLSAFVFGIIVLRTRNEASDRVEKAYAKKQEDLL